MNRLTWVMLVVACMLIERKVLDSTAIRTAISSTKGTSQERSEPQKGRVIAIIHSPAKVSAMVGPILVHEQDMVGDVKVVKIEKDRVHFEKLGIEWSQTVHDSPSQFWE